MDGHRFDELSRSLAGLPRGVGSRRRFLAGLGALAATFAARDAAADRCPAGQFFRRGWGCVCRTTRTRPVNGACPCAKGELDENGRVCSRCRSAADCPRDACVVSTACVDGRCVGDPIDCDDGIACTIDSCDVTRGCIHTPRDGRCDDGNPCTINTCDPIAGCQTVRRPDGPAPGCDGLCCDGTCLPIPDDPLDCGCTGVRCPFNETCAGGACSCRGGPSAAPYTCCPPDRVAPDSACVSPAPNTPFLDATTCDIVDDCPPGTLPCPGTSCRVCCPVGTPCAGPGFCQP